VVLLAAGIFGLAALFGIGRVYHRRAVAERMARSVLSLPTLAGAPEPLRLRLHRAHALALDPATVLAGVGELGRLFRANAYLDEAEQCWKLLSDAEPRNARWAYYLADARSLASDEPAMAHWLTKSTELAPDYAPAWLRLGDLSFKTGQLDLAARAYRTRLALLPGDPYANLGLARIALQRGDRAEARTTLQRLVEAAPEFSSAHNLYAELLSADGDATGAARERARGSEAGRFREADDPWIEELMTWCFSYETLCRRGTVDVLTKHPAHALALFKRAIDLEPRQAAAYELLGNLYVDLGKLDTAREIYTEGLARAGRDAAATKLFVGLSRVWLRLKRPADAARVARDGLKHADGDAELEHALGLALGQLGETSAAVEALRSAARTGDARTNYDFAVALIAVRQLDEGIEALHRSLTLEPTFPETLALLAQIEIDSGRWRAAGQYLQPLYAAHPELPEARAQMASYYLQCGIEAEKKGDVAEAEKSYLSGAAIDATRADLQLRLGALRLVQRRFAGAVAPLEVCHRLEPDNAQAALYLGEAYAASGQRQPACQVLNAAIEAADRSGNAMTAAHARALLRRVR